MVRFRSMTPLLLAAVFSLTGLGEDGIRPVFGGEYFAGRCSLRPIPDVPSIHLLRVPAVPGHPAGLWPNFTDEYDTRPYFVRYPVTQYGYRTLVLGRGIVYRSDAARLWAPGRLAFFTSQRPWFASAGFAWPLDRRPAALPAREMRATPPRPTPVLVRNPFATQAPANTLEEAEGVPAVAGQSIRILSENSDGLRPLRIANSHLQSEK
ncbi:hypothetical protein [Thermopirellula anaerolimosa]